MAHVCFGARSFRSRCCRFSFIQIARAKIGSTTTRTWTNSCWVGRWEPFVFSQHCKSCRTVGISEEKIEAIPKWEESECFNEIERAVLAYTDCLAINNGLVTDEIFQTLTEHLSDEEILELTYIVATYGMHGIISRALQLEFDDDENHPLEEIEGDHQSLSQEHTERRMQEIIDKEKSGG